MSETVWDYLIRSGVSPESVRDHLDAGRVQLNSEPVTGAEQTKGADDVVSIGLGPV